MTPGQGGEGPSINLARVKVSCRKYLKLAEMGVQRSDAEGSAAGIMRTGSIQPSPGTTPPWHISSDISAVTSVTLLFPSCPSVPCWPCTAFLTEVISCVLFQSWDPHTALVMALGSLCSSRLDLLCHSSLPPAPL